MYVTLHESLYSLICDFMSPKLSILWRWAPLWYKWFMRFAKVLIEDVL